MAVQIDWIIAEGALPEDGELVWIKKETPIEQSGFFMSRAYYHAGMYWQDANDSTKRYALNAVTHWAVMNRAE